MNSRRNPSPLSRGTPGKRKRPADRAPRQNLLTHLLDRAKRDPGRVALLASSPGPDASIPYGTLLDRIEELASGLSRLGIKKGDSVAVLSENRPEWTMADFAIMAVGGVTVPIHTNLSTQQMAYQLKHSRTRLIFLSRGLHQKAVGSIRNKLPHLKGLVFFDDSMPAGHVAGDLSIHDLMALGSDNRIPLEALGAKIASPDPASIIYTSGTNSQWPRGVLLTHENFLAEKEALEGLKLLREQDVIVSFLPLSHILQRVVDMLALLGGATLAYCANRDEIGEKLREFRPHLLVGVPRTYEKIQHLIMENLLYSPLPLKEFYQRVFQWMENDYLQRDQGGRIAPAIGLPARWMTKRATQKIMDRMGGRVRFCFSAGAPLSRETEAFFQIIRLPLFNVYGMTELTGAVTANYPARCKPGTVGVPLPGCEIRFAGDTEILVRGKMVAAGYYRPGKPPERIADQEGWLATGDLGRMDPDGFLSITGRKKELLITAAGKNIPPQPIEGRLRRNPYIRQAMVVGDGRNYLTALIVPAFSKLEAFASKKRILFMNRAELLEHPKVRGLYHDIVGEINKDLSRFETLKRFALLPEPFSQEAGELTSTHRLRRHIIERHYRLEIDEMYWGPP